MHSEARPFAKVPGEQMEQVDPAPKLIEPEGHVKHDVAPENGWYVPRMQFEQADDDDAPDSDPNVPDGQ